TPAIIGHLPVAARPVTKIEEARHAAHRRHSHRRRVAIAGTLSRHARVGLLRLRVDRPVRRSPLMRAANLRAPHPGTLKAGVLGGTALLVDALGLAAARAMDQRLSTGTGSTTPRRPCSVHSELAARPSSA